MGHALEIKFLQRLHPGKMRVLNPPRNCLAIALFDLRSQQRFQITQVRLLLLDRFFSQAYELIASVGKCSCLAYCKIAAC